MMWCVEAKGHWCVLESRRINTPMKTLHSLPSYNNQQPYEVVTTTTTTTTATTTAPAPIATTTDNK